MLFLRLLLFVVSFGFLGVAAVVVLYDIYLAFELNRLLRLGERPPADAAKSQTTATPTGGTQSPDTPATPLSPVTRPSFYLPPRSSGPRRAICWSTAAKFVVLAALSSLLARASWWCRTATPQCASARFPACAPAPCTPARTCCAAHPTRATFRYPRQSVFHRRIRESTRQGFGSSHRGSARRTVGRPRRHRALPG